MLTRLRTFSGASALAAIFALGTWTLPAIGGELAAIPAKPAKDLDLSYEVYAGGLHALSVDARVALGRDQYEAALEARTDGWLAWLLDFSLESKVKGESKVDGRTGRPDLQPDSYRSASQWEDRARSVDIDYAADDLPRVQAVPPPEEDDRDPVPEDLRRGTVDPLSAGLGLVLQLAEDRQCGGAASIFDGRRLFSASARHVGSAELSPSGSAAYGGTATVCGLTVEPVTGFMKSQDRQPEPREVTVYFLSVVEGGPPVPVRIDSESRFGAVRVHLIEARHARTIQ